MMKTMLLFVFSAAFVSACTKANPNACCVNADDCKQAGLSSVKGCDQGLTCVDNQCIQQTCSTDGCMADKPVCNVVSNACEGCTDSSQCASYPATKVCDTSTGGCVGCLTASDCPADMPVCDSNSCRACVLDSDCASAACGANGRCVDVGDAVYVDTAGSDAGTCSQAAPCKTIAFGLSKLSATRSHLVLAMGTYQQPTVYVQSSAVSSPMIEIHGGGATLTTLPNNDGGMLSIQDVYTTLHDVVFKGNSLAGFAIGASAAPAVIYRVNVLGGGNTTGFVIGGNVTVHDVDVSGASVAFNISTSGHLTLDRAVLHDSFKGIVATISPARVDVTNTLVFSMSGLAMDLSGANGSVSFTTVGDSGSVNGSEPIAIKCPSTAGLMLSSSIVWTPQVQGYSSIGGMCALSAVIAGPTAVPGAMNVNPMFVDETHRDYHLGAGSPARDVLDSGPAFDFEGDARPQGPKFDLGADEAK